MGGGLNQQARDGPARGAAGGRFVRWFVAPLGGAGGRGRPARGPTAGARRLRRRSVMGQDSGIAVFPTSGYGCIHPGTSEVFSVLSASFLILLISVVSVTTIEKE